MMVRHRAGYSTILTTVAGALRRCLPLAVLVPRRDRRLELHPATTAIIAQLIPARRLICRHTAAVIGGVLISSNSSFAAPDVVVVVARNSPISSLTIDQAIDIFLGRNASLPGVGRVSPVDHPEESPVRREFYEKAARKDAAQLKAYWSRRIFTGKGEPPPEVENAAAVKRILAADPHAIGYIPKSAVDESVKPLLVIP